MAEVAKFCSSCGRAFSDEATQFCAGCGTRRAGANADAPAPMSAADWYTPVERTIAPTPTTRSNRLSLFAIACGLAAVLIFPVMLGPAGIVLAVLARRRQEPHGTTALGVAIGGMVVGVILGAALADV